MALKSGIEAVAFDCFGTLVEYGDEQFTEAYGIICATQGLPVSGDVFYAKWMEVWRRLARDGRTTDGGTVGVMATNSPAALGPAVEVPEHPEHHTPSAGRSRALDGAPPPFRPYSEEWPEHFALCFEELGVKGEAEAAYRQLIELIGAARAFPEARRVVDGLNRRLPVALLSNADDNFLMPVLQRNGLVFPVTLSSERARAYKPHQSIFEKLSEGIGVPRERILYVGDSMLADVTGSKNAGLQAAWVNRKGKPPLEQMAAKASGEASQPRRDLREPDIEIESLDALVDMLIEA